MGNREILFDESCYFPKYIVMLRCIPLKSHSFGAVITPCVRMRSRGIVFCCQFVCLKVCLSALFWAVCAFEERSRARLNPDR